MMNTITKELFKHARTLDAEIKVKQKAFDETHFSQSGEKQIMLAILNWLENEV